MANNSYVERARKSLIRRAPPFQPAGEAMKDVYIRRRIEGMGAGEARQKAGMSYELYKHAITSDPGFRSAEENVDQTILDRLEDVAKALAFKGDSAMIRWWLEHGRPEKFGKKSKVEVSHRFQGPEDIRKLSDEDLMAEFELLGIEVKNQ